MREWFFNLSDRLRKPEKIAGTIDFGSAMDRAQCFPRESRGVELAGQARLIRKSDREGRDMSIALPHPPGHKGGIESSAEERAHRYVGNHLPVHRLDQLRCEERGGCFDGSWSRSGRSEVHLADESSISREPKGVTGEYLMHVRPHRVWCRHEPVEQELRESVRRDGGLSEPGAEQRPDLRRERHLARSLRPIQRFDSDRVSHQHQLAPRPVVEGECEHPIQPLKTRYPPAAVRAEDYLGVGRGAKGNRLEALELSLQLRIVVDLAVEHDPRRSIGQCHGLIARFQIDDAEAAMREEGTEVRGVLET